MLPRLRRLGFVEAALKLELDDARRQVVRILGRRAGMSQLVLLAEMVLARRAMAPPPEIAGGDLSMLQVEWLLLQDPTRRFSAERPPLPGQEHPGLGMADDAQELLVQVCRRLGLEGISHHPAHFHNAVWAARQFRFLSPEAEGRFRAMRRALASLHVAQASAAVEEGRLRLEDGTAVAWRPDDFVLPVASRLGDYFASRDYTERMMAAMNGMLEAGLGVVERPSTSTSTST